MSIETLMRTHLLIFFVYLSRIKLLLYNFVQQVKTINMEAEDLLKDRVHHGHNIKRIRMRQGLKQDAMAELANMSQQTVSRYENMKEIDEEMLQRFAKALKVPVEVLETMEEDASMIVFENIENITNNNNDHAVSNVVGKQDYEDSSQNTFNPIDKITELYERLLKEEKDKNKELEQRIIALELKLK